MWKLLNLKKIELCYPMSQQFYFYTHNPKKMKLPHIKDIYTPMDTAALLPKSSMKSAYTPISTQTVKRMWDRYNGIL